MVIQLAKLMAPNTRVDWYPEGHFENIKSPTITELNSGTNLSCAIVTGYTLDFTDTNVEDVSNIFDNFNSVEFGYRSYEANLQFFLAPRGSTEDNEKAFRDAEELFYKNHRSTGYLVKRFGYHSSEPYKIGQKVDIFKVQSNLPRVIHEEGAPVILEVSFNPKGEAGSAVGQYTYEWEGEPHNSTSVKLWNNEVVSRNLIANPSFELDLLGYTHGSGVSQLLRSGTTSRAYAGNYSIGVRIADSPLGGGWVGTTINGLTPGKWIGFSCSVRRSSGPLAYRYWLGYSGTGVWLSPYIAAASGNPLNIPRAVSAVQVPPNVNSAQLWVRFYQTVTGGAPPDGLFNLDAWHAVEADTEKEALEQVKNYFDGDTPNE